MGLKVARFVLKIIGFSLALAAVVCCVVAYWDKITSAVSGLKDKVGDKGACCCHPSEFDDYADWDE